MRTKVARTPASPGQRLHNLRWSIKLPDQYAKLAANAKTGIDALPLTNQAIPDGWGGDRGQLGTFFSPDLNSFDITKVDFGRSGIFDSSSFSFAPGVSPGRRVEIIEELTDFPGRLGGQVYGGFSEKAFFTFADYDAVRFFSQVEKHTAGGLVITANRNGASRELDAYVMNHAPQMLRDWQTGCEVGLVQAVNSLLGAHPYAILFDEKEKGQQLVLFWSSRPDRRLSWLVNYLPDPKMGREQLRMLGRALERDVQALQFQQPTLAPLYGLELS